MTEKSLDQLIKASTKAATEQLQHLLVVITPDGRIRLNGTDNMVTALYNDVELLNQIETVMQGNKQEGGGVNAMALLDYPLLPCPPSSEYWKGSKKIRGILSKMLLRAGYGRAGTKKNLGVGLPPLGWPEDIIAWTDFKGPTRSRLTINQVTQIIVNMLRGANLNPETHVVPQQEEQAVVENNDSDTENEDNEEQNDVAGEVVAGEERAIVQAEFIINDEGMLDPNANEDNEEDNEVPREVNNIGTVDEFVAAELNNAEEMPIIQEVDVNENTEYYDDEHNYHGNKRKYGSV